MNSRVTRAKRQLACTASLLTVASAVAACNDAGSGTDAGELRIGTQPWLGYGAWYIAEDQGFTSDHDVDLTLTNFTTDDQVNTALAAGKLDGANVATHTALKMMSADVPVTIVMLEDVSTSADGIAAIGMRSVADLEGQKVAYEEGTTSDILLHSALAEGGLSIDDVQKVPLPAADAGGALLAGKVPAAVTYEPYLSQAVNQDQSVEMLYTAGEQPGLISDVLVIRNDVIDDRPDDVQALVDAWSDSVAYYEQNTEDARKVISEGVGAEPAELAEAFDGVEFYGADDNASMLDGEFKETTIVEVLEASQAAGIVQEDVDLDAAIDTQFVADGS